MMRKVKLLFTCWKTCVLSLVAGRGRQLRYFFLSWRSEIASRKDDAVVSQSHLSSLHPTPSINTSYSFSSAFTCSYMVPEFIILPMNKTSHTWSFAQEICLSIEHLKMKRFFSVMLKKFNNRMLLRGVLNSRLTGCSSAWQKLKERAVVLSIATEDVGGTRSPMLSPHLAADLGPDNESCHGIGYSSHSFASTLKSRSMETHIRGLKGSRGDARSPSPTSTPHTPSRCTIRQCIACCRKAMPRSSPQGSLLRSSLDGSYLKSSLDGSLLKATPHPQLSPQLEDIEKKNRRDSRAFLRFTPEFSARQLPTNPFSLIGTYIAVDEGPVLTKAESLEEREKERRRELGVESDQDKDTAKMNFDEIQENSGDDGDAVNRETLAPHTPFSAKKQVPALDLSLDKDKDSAKKGRSSTSNYSSGAQKSKRKATTRPFTAPFPASATRNLGRSGSKVPAQHSLAAEDIDIELCRRDDDVRRYDKVKHVVFKNRSRDADEMEDSGGTGRLGGGGGGVRVMSRLEANFIKRLSIVQKLDNDFVVRKYCVNVAVAD